MTNGSAEQNIGMSHLEKLQMNLLDKGTLNEEITESEERELIEALEALDNLAKQSHEKGKGNNNVI